MLSTSAIFISVLNLASSTLPSSRLWTALRLSPTSSANLLIDIDFSRIFRRRNMPKSVCMVRSLAVVERD